MKANRAETMARMPGQRPGMADLSMKVFIGFFALLAVVMVVHDVYGLVTDGLQNGHIPFLMPVVIGVIAALAGWILYHDSRD